MSDVIIKGKFRSKPIPEGKLESVKEISEKMKSARTVLIASTKSLPASQFQKIKKSLRGKAEVIVAKKSILERAIKATEKGALQNLRAQLKADICIMFSDEDAFSLASILIDSQTPSKAKAGDVSPRDIEVEPGPTELIPGPAISELGAVGLKVAVEDGKLAIKQGATIVKEGEVIDPKVASVLGKLKIEPMKVGFIPLAAYDSTDDKVYTEIKIDKEGALSELKTAISKALGFAINVGWTVKETISYFISKAAMEEKALSAKVGSGSETTSEEKTEAVTEEKPAEEKKEDDSKNDKEEA